MWQINLLMEFHFILFILNFCLLNCWHLPMNHAPLICNKAKYFIFGNFKIKQKMIFQTFLFHFFIFQVEKHSIPDISKQKRGNTKKWNAQKSNSNKSNKLNSSFNFSSIWKGLNWQCLSFIEWTLSFYVILQIWKIFLFFMKISFDMFRKILANSNSCIILFMNWWKMFV